MNTNNLQAAAATGVRSVPFDAAGLRLHGEIISWAIPVGTKVAFDVLVSQLAAAGLDDKAARAMTPANAFARACHTLQEKRIIRRVIESQAELRFQFTAEIHEGDRLRYDMEAVLTLDKLTGKVSCEASPALADLAQKSIDAAIAVRSTNDVTKLINKLFAQAADLFPVRDQGGCYFVPAMHREFVEKVEIFVRGLNGSLRRFPVPAGFAAGDRSVAESVQEGLEGMLADHLKAVADFDDTTRDSTLTKMVERINATRFKAEAYAEFLAERKEEIEAAVAGARAVLRKKIADMGRKVEVPEPDGTVPPAPPADDDTPAPTEADAIYDRLMGPAVVETAPAVAVAPVPTAFDLEAEERRRAVAAAFAAFDDL